MDKRIIKTKEKILQAFKEVIEVKNFQDITIQDILEKSKVARSTFYKHFETKYDLLEAVINHIFEHVFGHTLQEEKNHDFSKSSILDYKHYISHILYHLDEEKTLIKALLNSSSKMILIESIVHQFKPFARICVNNNFFYNYHVPKSLLLESVISNFITVILYWNKTDFKDTPETLTEYFINLNKRT